MGNVENPEQAPEQPLAPTDTEPGIVDEVGNWVKSIFEPTPEAQLDTPNANPPSASTTPNATNATTTTTATTKSTTPAPSLQKSATPTTKETATVSLANNNNIAPKKAEPQAPVVDPNLYGQVTIRIVKGSRFPKSDPTSLEIGFAWNEDGSWVISESDKLAKEREANPIQHNNGVMTVSRRPMHHANPLKSERAKAGENPVFHNCVLQGAWHKGEHVRIAVYAKGMPKDKLLGVAKLDYNFFRSWYLGGKRTEERRVGLEYEKKNKDKEYGIYLTVNYEGVSLAPEKEVMGMTFVDMKLSAKNTMKEVNNDFKAMGKDIDEFCVEATSMQKEFTKELIEPEKKENALEKVERKVSNINPFNRLNPF